MEEKTAQHEHKEVSHSQKGSKVPGSSVQHEGLDKTQRNLIVSLFLSLSCLVPAVSCLYLESPHPTHWDWGYGYECLFVLVTEQHVYSRSNWDRFVCANWPTFDERRPWQVVIISVVLSIQSDRPYRQLIFGVRFVVHLCLRYKQLLR